MTTLKPSSSSASEVDVCIVGGGPAGLLAAKQILARTELKVDLVEAESSLGGVIARSRYPGSSTDIPWIVLPGVFAAPTRPTNFFADSDWFAGYAEALAAEISEGGAVLLDTAVISASWDGSGNRWSVETDSGRTLRPRFLVWATGDFGRAEIPVLPGAEEFRGRLMHANSGQPVDPAALQSAVVVGSGATAAQLVPSLAQVGIPLTVVIENATWVLPRWNPEIPKDLIDWLERVAPLRRAVRSLAQVIMELLMWAGITKRPRSRALAAPAALLAKRHLRKSVAADELRALLRPSFPFHMGRPILSSDFLQSLSLPNVTVRTGSVVSADADSLHLASGERIPASTVIFATGFRFNDDERPPAIFCGGGAGKSPVQSGNTLSGTMVSDQPNLFFVGGAAVPIGWSWTVSANLQSKLIAEILREAGVRHSTRVHVLSPPGKGPGRVRAALSQSSVAIAWSFRASGARHVSYEG